MRTTLDIDDAVLAALKETARRENRTAGAVASELLRSALTSPVHRQEVESIAKYGFIPFAPRRADQPVSNDEVGRIREDLGI